ncbi:MAG: hypothetical protein ACRDI2_10515 [Chloroflexota bacterium]
MNREAAPIDLRTAPELAHAAEEVRASRRPRLLQKDGETIAVVMPVGSKRRAKRAPTQADKEAFLSAFGAWKGNVDVDRLKRDLAESRKLSRPPAEL